MSDVSKHTIVSRCQCCGTVVGGGYGDAPEACLRVENLAKGLFRGLMLMRLEAGSTEK